MNRAARFTPLPGLVVCMSDCAPGAPTRPRLTSPRLAGSFSRRLRFLSLSRYPSDTLRRGAVAHRRHLGYACLMQVRPQELHTSCLAIRAANIGQPTCSVLKTRALSLAPLVASCSHPAAPNRGTRQILRMGVPSGRLTSLRRNGFAASATAPGGFPSHQLATTGLSASGVSIANLVTVLNVEPSS